MLQCSFEMKGKRQQRGKVCATMSAYLNDEIDELQLPHLLHLKVSYKETDIVPLSHANTNKREFSEGNHSRSTGRRGRYLSN